MVLLLISFTISAGGDYMAAWPRGEDLKTYDPDQAYRLSLDFSFLPRHKIGFAFHPIEFKQQIRYEYNWDFKGRAFDFYYGFDLSSIFLDIPPRLFVILGGCYHPWHLEYPTGEVVELPTGKVDFKDWGYLGGLELSYAPVRFLDLRIGTAYYYLMSEHMDRLGFDDHDEKYIVGYAGLRFSL